MILCMSGFFLGKICDGFGRGIVGLDGRRDARYFFYDIFFVGWENPLFAWTGGWGWGTQSLGDVKTAS